MKNEVLDLSFRFSVKIICFCKEHKNIRNQYFPVYNQLLKSGTSIGANIEEANGAQSTRDFLAKMYIAFKEAKETHYWLKLMTESNIVEFTEIESLMNDINSIKNLLGAITKKTKYNLQKSINKSH